MAASYETYATLQRIIECGAIDTFTLRWKPVVLARFLRKQFREGVDPFIAGDPILSRLDPKRIQYFALACCLIDGGKDLDGWVKITAKKRRR